MKKFFAILTLVLLPGLANASSTISLYPATVNIEPIPAGEITLQQLKFANKTGETGTFTVEAEDYRLAGPKELEYLPLGSTNNSLEGMLEFTPTEFELKDGETQDIAVKIAPPIDAKSGRYQGVIFVGPIAKDNDEEASVRLAGRVGALFGVTVGDAAEPVNQTNQLDRLYRDNKLALALAAFTALLVLGFLSNQNSKKSKKTKKDY